MSELPAGTAAGVTGLLALLSCGMTAAGRAARPAAVALAILAAPAAASPGDLDRSFGGDGIVTASRGDGLSLGALHAGPSGILAAGDVFRPPCSDVALARWSAGGRLERLSAPALGPCAHEEDRYGVDVHALLLEPDGRVITGGRLLGGYRWLAFLTAHRPDGRLDAPFGSGGWIHDGFTDGALYDIVRLDDGRLVAAGEMYEIGHHHAEIHRYHANGALDGSFARGGVADFGEGGFAAIVADGAAVVAAGTLEQHGDARETLGVTRVAPDGAIDPAFGAAGRAEVAPPGLHAEGHDLVRTADGGFLVAGSAYPDQGEHDRRWLLVKLDPAGAVNPRFGSGGTVLGPLGRPSAMAVDRAGRIVVAGAADGRFAVARFLADGALDPAFGDRGIARVDVDAVPADVALQPDGRIVAGGTSGMREPGARRSMVVVRLLGDEPYRASSRAGRGVGIRIVSRRVTRSGVLVRVTWPRGATGRVTARLWTRAGRVLLGARTVAVLPGTTSRTLRSPSNARARRMLDARRRLKVRATVRVSG